MTEYRAAHEVMAGDMIYLAPTSSTPSRILEVREPTHALAGAYGATVFEVETYITDWGRFHRGRPFTAWPNSTFRVEAEPEIWENNA